MTEYGYMRVCAAVPQVRTPLTAITIIGLIILLTAMGCGGGSHDARLERIGDMLSDAPKKALRALDSIDPGALSEKDRAFYGFLSVKANDKAFIPHTSDSVILKVVSYAGAHQNEGYFPEALYYAGRVYKDLGDSPTAADYFQKALEFLPPDSEDQDLRSRVMSQTGGLLNDLRLYDEAIPYIKESIEYSRQLNDTAGEVLDLQMLGNTYLRANKLHEADSCLRLSLLTCHDLSPSYRAKSRMYLAAVKKKLGETDSALFYIRNILDSVKPIVRNNVLAHASQIYWQAGIFDTAYIYADQLIHTSGQTNNKKIGYEVVFLDSVVKYVPIDSVVSYALDYHHSVEQTFNEHGAQLAILQQSTYNYTLHQRERLKAEERNRILKNWIIAISFILLIAALIILWLKNRNHKTIIKLRSALDNISCLERSLLYEEGSNESVSPELSPVSPNETVEELRKQLRDKLQDLYKKNGDSKNIPSGILRSASYEKLRQLIKEEKELKENDPLWKELEETILEGSPSFKKRLYLLVGGSLSSFDLHTSLLIKCGITPSQMAILLNRTKGTIVSRRESICVRIFDEKLGTKTIDAIIRLL